MKLATLGVALALALAWPRPGWAAPQCKVNNGEIEVQERSAQIAVVLSNPPTTRAQLSFDAGDHHHELEWDPAVDSRLEQHVKLEAVTARIEGKPDPVPVRWRVTATVEPVTLRQGSVITLITTTPFGRPIPWDLATLDPGKQGLLKSLEQGTSEQKAWAAQDRKAEAAAIGAAAASASRQLQARYIAMVSDVGAAKTAVLQDWPAPTFTLSCRQLPTMDEVPFATRAAPGSSARALGTIPPPVTEALSILSEIAIDRAKAGALALVKERFVAPLCGDADQDDPSRGVRLGSLGLPGTSLALPRTCVLLQQLRLEDILSSGKPLLRAVRDDLRLTLAPAGIDRIARGTPWAPLARTALDIVNRAIERGSLSVLDAQAAFDLFKDVRPLLGAIPLFDLDSRKRLERAIEERLDGKAIAARCPGVTKPSACASALVAYTPLADLRAMVAGLGIDPERADLDAVFADFAAVEPLQAVIEPQLRRLSIALGRFPACGGLKVTDAATCALTTARGLASGLDVTALVDDLRFDADARATLLDVILHRFTKALDCAAASKRPPAADPVAPQDPDSCRHAPAIARAIGVACEVKLASAILRQCSGQSCSAEDISRMFEHPEQQFKPDQTVCWSGDDYRGVTADLGAYRAFVVDGLELLAAKAAPAARAAVMLRMLARVTQQAAGCGSGDPPTGRCRQLDAITELMIGLAEDDPTKALASATALVRQLVPRIPVQLTKGAQLIGSVAAYAEVYENTKGQDPKEAREARKKALEGLIDAATDRTGRGGAWVLSFGSNVGFGATRTQPRADIADSWAPQLRVPLGVALDELPADSRSGWRAGLHAGIAIGDLGQFAAVGNDGKIDAVRWDDFLGPGAELGVIVGSPTRAFNLSFHVEYAPALFASGDRSGALRFGLSLGYYVPFFDLN